MNQYKVSNLPDIESAITNKVYINCDDDIHKKCSYVIIDSSVFRLGKHDGIPKGYISIGTYHRKILQISTDSQVDIQPYDNYEKHYSENVMLRFNTGKSSTHIEFDPNDIIDKLLRNHVLFTGMVFFIRIHEVNVFCEIVSIDIEYSFYNKEYTQISYLPSVANIKLININTCKNRILFHQDDFNFKHIGVGGMNHAIDDLFKRVFASRMFDPEYIRKLGMKHVKGVLLYGPPGTGKTALARGIASLLKSVEPKIINGPEILNKYVGQSEENIRTIFADAENDFAQNGDSADLHVIIFDEIDAICKKRGSSSSSTGVNDTVVNQLLTKLDGVKAIPNILVIGMTNRRDMIDSALLRPGRLEVQIEIGLPDRHGRYQILEIHTHSMNENAFLSQDVDLYDIANKTESYSGAELEGIVRYASSCALERTLKRQREKKGKCDDIDICVCKEDFLEAIEKVSCIHKTNKIQFDRYFNDWIPDIVSQKLILDEIQTYISSNINTSKNIHKNKSILLYGPQFNGKTSIAIKAALKSDIKNIIYICARDILAMNELEKCSHLHTIMEQAYRTPQSIIIMDEIERLISYVRQGPFFSNSILQTLLVIARNIPPKNNHICIIGTTTLDYKTIHNLELHQAFKRMIHVDYITQYDIKYIIDYTRTSNDKILYEKVKENDKMTIGDILSDV